MHAAAPPPALPGPVLLPEVVEELLEDMGGDRVSVTRFVDDFIGLWPSRLARLHSAVSTENAEALDEVLLSIRCPAAMLGAVPLAELAESVRVSLKTGVADGGRVPLRMLEQLGASTCAALEGLQLSRAAMA